MAQADRRFICNVSQNVLVTWLVAIAPFEDRPLPAPLPPCGPHGRDARARVRLRRNGLPCLRPTAARGQVTRGDSRGSASRVIGARSEPGVRGSEDMRREPRGGGPPCPGWCG